MDTIECPSCAGKVIPRLWHYSPSFGGLRYQKTQHICPLCGVVMYETGGQLTLVGKMVVLAVVSGLSQAVVMHWANLYGEWVSYIFYGAVALFVAYIANKFIPLKLIFNPIAQYKYIWINYIKPIFKRL